VTSLPSPDPLGRWFHAGEGSLPPDGGQPLLPCGGAGDPLASAGAKRRQQILSALLGQKRAEAEARRHREGSLRRQISERERAREDLADPPPRVAPAGDEGAAAPFWSPLPVLGFRMWRLTSLGMRGVVQSWREPRVEAVCPRGPGVPHDAPGCRCGIYALKDPGALWALRPGAGPILVYGLVALSGKVVEHEHGYRAGCAEVVAVAVLRSGAMLCRSDPAWIERLFLPGLGLAEAETGGGVRALGPGLPVDGVEYLEDEARRFREKWTLESRSG
jgi:hypothetical protein